ncbi:bifunctional riboflavin kinase/FAD synthetase [Atopomonas sediminilitoris]|uniref:bifunctional riboflavin kinase/FAD synthetase n=1 Tax=Atopomonas sediminilitoris TaxID=2919919 RepID=UPI001F4E6726|nr:bifunctional riboflavin kinase/FAD synthetase [Atopomonas sediminilitoris]MCJ8170648.1 bifunctional riboflavin kinase/FAD synthetase [Atopomonas sediminilitoris]
MELVRGLHNLRPRHRGHVVSIGNFDGVHMGHQAILARLHDAAARADLPSCVVLFEPQPREFFAGKQAPARLSRLRDKLALLAEAGVDRVLCLAFNERLRELTADAFVQKILCDGLGVQHLQVGDDFRFGCDRAGDFAFLQQTGTQLGFSVENNQTVALGAERVSSTRIRAALDSGDFATAESLLGRPYVIQGRVLHGQKLGRTIGVPTANIQLKRLRAPLHGVYVVSAERGGQRWAGVANIGERPTVQGDGQAHLEVHLLDFAGDLYGQRLSVQFHAKVRDEQKFAGLDALKAAIEQDIAAARAYWQQHPLSRPV